jgi:hypothetical protein
MNTINASSATCTYQLEGLILLQCNASTDSEQVSCELTSDNEGTKSLIKEGYVFLGTNATSKLVNVNFQNVSENKWECPSKIYYGKAETGGWNYSKISIEGTGNNDLSTANLVEEKSSYGDLISEVKEDVKYCKYGSLILAINNTTEKVYAANETSCSLSIAYSDIQSKDIEKDSDGCPKEIYYFNAKYGNYSSCGYSFSIKYSETIELNGTDPIFDATNSDANGNEPTTVDKEYANSCSDLGESLTLLRQIYTFMRYLVPILIVVLSIVDFAKVVLLGDEKTYKAAWDKFIKRLIIGVVILILPAILSLIINMSGALDSYGVDKNNIFCIFS